MVVVVAVVVVVVVVVGEDIGKLTRKRLNTGLPGREQGTVRNQLALSVFRNDGNAASLSTSIKYRHTVIRPFSSTGEEQAVTDI